MTNNGGTGSPPSLSSATFNNDESGIQQSSLSEDSPAAMNGVGGIGDGRDNVNSINSEGAGEGGEEGGELGAILNGGGSQQQQQGGIGEVGLSKDDDSAIGAFSEQNEGAAGDLGDQRHMVDGSNGQGK